MDGCPTWETERALGRKVERRDYTLGRLAALPRRKCRLSVIVVSWNTTEVLRGCLESVREHLADDEHEVIVVDNASSDGSPEMVVRDFPEIGLIRNTENLGFGAGCNVGMAASRGDAFLLLNSDARLVGDAAQDLLTILRARPDVGVVGPRLIGEDGRLQASARRFPSIWRLALTELGLYRLLSRRQAADELLGHYWDHGEERQADWLVGACFLVRRRVFEQTGGFDPGMFLYGEEVEWCRRIRACGWEVLFTPAPTVLHLDHRSADVLLGSRGRIDRCLLAEDRLLRRWEGTRGLLAPPLRVVGALLRLVTFGMRALLRPREPYYRAVIWDACATLEHYWRRAKGDFRGVAR